MGNVQSGAVYRKLDKEIPPWTNMSGYYTTWHEVGQKVFVDNKDREQFIYAIIAVATSNGLRNLDDHDFQLLYARRATGNSKDRMIARIVAVKDGVIRAKIEPEEDGEDQLQAFSALRKDIEVKLDRILMTVPEQLHDAGEAGASVSNGVSRARSDAPPAYTGPEVGILASKAGR